MKIFCKIINNKQKKNNKIYKKKIIKLLKMMIV